MSESSDLSLTSATITLRIIKSFEFRTEKSLVLHNIDLTRTTVGDLKNLAFDAVRSLPGWKAYRNLLDEQDESRCLNTIKIYTKAHGSKTSNLIINLDHEDWILNDDGQTLESAGFENETEASFFNRISYEVFKLNPETRWE